MPVKLWREATPAKSDALLCAACCTVRRSDPGDYKRSRADDYGPIREDGRCAAYSEGRFCGMTDYVAEHMRPAVLMEGGDLCREAPIPKELYARWRALPLTEDATPKPPRAARLAAWLGEVDGVARDAGCDRLAVLRLLYEHSIAIRVRELDEWAEARAFALEALAGAAPGEEVP